MGNQIYHFLFDTYRVDIPLDIPPPPPTFYETSVAWEILKFTGMSIGVVISSVVLFISMIIHGGTQW